MAAPAETAHRLEEAPAGRDRFQPVCHRKSTVKIIFDENFEDVFQTNFQMGLEEEFVYG